jgi:RNA polymerase sigma-70 factor (ECF subfamily)
LFPSGHAPNAAGCIAVQPIRMERSLESERLERSADARHPYTAGPVLVTDQAAAEQCLIERARKGDAEAFGVLVEGYLPRALRLAMRVLRQREDAEDLVQDAFLSALRHIDTFDAHRPFWPWLSRIIVNRGIDLSVARSIRVTSELTADLADGGESPSAGAERDDVFARVRRAMSSLPPRRRMVVELFELDGLSVAEIAESMETAPATVRWHLHVARRQLRHALQALREASA